LTRKTPVGTPGRSRVEARLRTKLAIAAGVVAAAVAIYLLFFRGSPEERIRGQLARLAHTVEVDPGAPENPIARLGRIRGELKELFVEQPSIDIPELTTLGSSSTRNDLADLAAQAPQAWSSVKIDFASTRVTLDASKKSADVTTIATLTGARAGGEPTRDVRRVVLRFELVDGEWRIGSLKVAPREEPG
jgi:hypothetical protein